ncbi:MAG: hypothetical protein ACPHY8_00835 [Patescibacteria group bacterium]
MTIFDKYSIDNSHSSQIPRVDKSIFLSEKPSLFSKSSSANSNFNFSATLVEVLKPRAISLVTLSPHIGITPEYFKLPSS